MYVLTFLIWVIFTMKVYYKYSTWVPLVRVLSILLHVGFEIHPPQRDFVFLVAVGWMGGGGVFVLFFEICISPLMTTTMRVTLSAVSAGSCGSVY